MGCSIAVHYHSSTDAANTLVEELRGKGVRAEAFKADLTKYEEVSEVSFWVRLGTSPLIMF
jgi:3-oxoacyl-[acyl-carrier protein] reductase